MSEEGSETSGGKQDKENIAPSGFLKEFTQLVTNLKSLNLLHFFADQAVEDVIHMRVSLDKYVIASNLNFAVSIIYV